MKCVALLALLVFCVTAVPSMRNRPWRMGKDKSAGHTGPSAQTQSHSVPKEEKHKEPVPEPMAQPIRASRRKGTEGIQPVLQHDLNGDEEKTKHQLPPFPFIEESRADQPAMDGMPDFTMKEIMQQVQRHREFEEQQRLKKLEAEQRANDYSHHFQEEDSDHENHISDHNLDHIHDHPREKYNYMSQYRQYQPHTDTIGHELFMMRTPPRFLLCYEGFDNGTTVMQKSCFTLKTDLQCRPLSELNVAPDHHHISKKHYCMPKTCHSDTDCQTVPMQVGSCRSQHGRRGGTPGLARCTIGCSAILFLAACRVSLGADIILERTCLKKNEVCTSLFHETLELGSHMMVADFCHQRDYKRGLTPSPRQLFCPPGHRSHHPVPQLPPYLPVVPHLPPAPHMPQVLPAVPHLPPVPPVPELQVPESFYTEDAHMRPQILGRSTRSLHHGPPHVLENHPNNHNSYEHDQHQHPLDYSPIPESVLPAGLIPYATPQEQMNREYSVPVEVPGHRYGVPSPLQMHHQIPPPSTLEKQRKQARANHYYPPPRRNH